MPWDGLSSTPCFAFPPQQQQQQQAFTIFFPHPDSREGAKSRPSDRARLECDDDTN